MVLPTSSAAFCKTQQHVANKSGRDPSPTPMEEIAAPVQKKRRKRPAHPTHDDRSWKSPTLSTRDLSSTVTIPKTGWYAFCFGRSVLQKWEQGPSKSANGSSPAASPSFQCVIATPMKDMEGSSQPELATNDTRHCKQEYPKDKGPMTRILSLPLQSQSKPPKQFRKGGSDNPAPTERVDVLEAGKLFHWEMGANVSLSLAANSQCDRDEEVQNNATLFPEWQIVEYRHQDATFDWETVQKQKLVCAVCCSRMFASQSSLSSHVHSVHRSEQTMDPLWTTPLRVVFQDNHVAVVDKPQGMAVQGAKPSLERSDLLCGLKNPPATDPGDKANQLSKPTAVHRLDSATGGLLLIAKTKSAERDWKAVFRNRPPELKKRYRAIVLGSPDQDSGICHEKVDGKYAETRWTVLRRVCHEERGETISILDLFPKTGRTHQLRKHCKYLGHPILGDKRYGGTRRRTSHTTEEASRNEKLVSKLCLWHVGIDIPHPARQEEVMQLKLPTEPDWISEVVEGFLS